MTQHQIDELGPIDYVVIEWEKGKEPSGEAAPLIIDLVERGIIRVLDIAFLAKDDDGATRTLDLGSFSNDERFAEFEGASSGLLSTEDLEEAAGALSPGTIAALLVWENRFIAPIAAALRRSGAQLVANGRVSFEDLMESLDGVEATR